MSKLCPENAPVHGAGLQLARLGGNHGYRLDGDTVHLHAMFTVLDASAHQQAWALQLWACPAAPTTAKDLAGRLVAEVPLPPIAEIADEIENFEVSAFARPPAGAADHVMALVLASGRRGQFNEVHDLAVYPRREQFVQPRMLGNLGFQIEGDRVRITVERIENPRPARNSSGTLSLELWALPEPYTGGDFRGAWLAGTTLGSLSGQFELAAKSFDLPFTSPPAGSWRFVLMLREWTAGGFLTRDFTNFASPMIYAARVETAPLTSASEAAIPKAAASAIAVAAVKRAAAHSIRTVSVNAATAEELASVKGLPTKVAASIVAKRPYASIDDLLRVKGMGAKLLTKLRSRLKL